MTAIHCKQNLKALVLTVGHHDMPPVLREAGVFRGHELPVTRPLLTRLAVLCIGTAQLRPSQLVRILNNRHRRNRLGCNSRSVTHTGLSLLVPICIPLAPFRFPLAPFLFPLEPFRFPLLVRRNGSTVGNGSSWSTR
jgi:hypothetical protein